MRTGSPALITKSGDLRIETLRGFAILAVVAHHATMIFSETLDTNELVPGIVRKLTHYQSVLLLPIRMPLFTVLSGWVYALKPFCPGDGRAFWLGKFRRILVPLFFAATVYYFVILVESGQVTHSNGDSPPIPPSTFFEVWFYHFGHLWFLQALLVIFGLVAVIDALGWMNSTRQWLMWVTAFALLPYAVPTGPSFWSLYKVDEILVFFVVGVGLRRFGHLWSKRPIIVMAWIGFATAMIAHVIYWRLGLNNSFDPWPHRFIAGALAPICILSLNFVFRPLAWIGGFSYAIYLYHELGFRLLKPFVSYLDSLPSRFIWFGLLLLLGLILPLVIHYTASRIPYVRTLVIGRASRFARNTVQRRSSAAP